jgi:hypothetical protein
MYLWKYWRETRIVFAASLVGIAGLFLLVWKQHGSMVIEPRPPFYGISAVLPGVLMIEAVPLIFLAWIYGSCGVGRDLGERSGSYIFSRPVSRAFFVWRDWGFGLAQLLVIVIGVNMVLGFELYRLLISFGDPYHGSFLLSGRPVPLAAILSMNCVVGFLLAALVFGLTYFSTVLIRSAKGVMLGAGVLVAYVALKGVAEHYWPWIALPTVIPSEFTQTALRTTGFADNLGIFLAIRALVLLLFPVAALFLLQKRDIE